MACLAVCDLPEEKRLSTKGTKTRNGWPAVLLAIVEKSRRGLFKYQPLQGCLTI